MISYYYSKTIDYVKDTIFKIGVVGIPHPPKP
jgi:hypothetical protein